MVAKQRPNKGDRHESPGAESALVYGRHAVLELLASDRQINKLFIQKGLANKEINDILDSVRQKGYIYQEVAKSKLDDLSQGANHQGLIATLPPYDYQTLEDAFHLAETRGEDPFFLILDELEDPHNLGSIIRSADAFGVHGIIIPKRRSVPLTGVVAKVSTGAIEHVPVIRVTNLRQTIESLQDRGVWVFATAMEGEDIRTWDSRGPLAIVIGNEGKGVSSLVAKVSDGQVTIPMVGHVQSLNAGVAAGILIYEVARHRLPSKK